MGYANIGWREWVSLPDLGLPLIKAKVDTGARTSALHAFKVQEYLEDGVLMVRFCIHPVQRRMDLERACEARVTDERIVTDSGGHKERRLVIETPVIIAGKTWPIELTLTNRETMMFRMLLGRTAISGHCYVDPNSSYLLGKPDAETLESAYQLSGDSK